ncbi:hypothetical protein O9H85_06755 [Paenibacillus filicis]|uniref:Uncharacterized protein n=1 Tax=Paenibacillus gyeongsangnamensis TaxID=3388067 RepID=A0ABT4Q5N4_9BACL|nr:hypothetical protein [Paenibacillus filicis]MCZ8512129.1 hypothetical protein [Paenibacillus filicis]
MSMQCRVRRSTSNDGLYDREAPFVLREQATPEAPITIRAVTQDKAVFTGRSSWVLDSSSYVVSEGTNERKYVPRNPLTAAEVGPDAPWWMKSNLNKNGKPRAAAPGFPFLL